MSIHPSVRRINLDFLWVNYLDCFRILVRTFLLLWEILVDQDLFGVRKYCEEDNVVPATHHTTYSNLIRNLF